MNGYLAQCPICGQVSDRRSWQSQGLPMGGGFTGGLADTTERLRTLEQAHANFVAGMFTRMSAVEHAVGEMLTDLKALQSELRPFIDQARGRANVE